MHMQTHIKNALKIHFIYIGNKAIYCIFKICCMSSVLFSPKCCLFHICSNNTFLINHMPEFKYQPGQVKVDYKFKQFTFMNKVHVKAV